MGSRPPAKRSQARLTITELTKEVPAKELQGLRVRASDAAALLGERSEEIEALDASGRCRA